MAPDLLHPWARWITPVGEVRRYDTRFFVAALPDGATPADLTSESSTAGWFPARAALAEGERGERILAPPTVAVLQSVAAYPTVERGVGRCGCARPDPGGPGASAGCRRHDASSSRTAPRCRCLGGPGDQRNCSYEQLRSVAACAAVVLAANPGPMTLSGTNTWVLRAPGSEGAIVVDPGPDDATHLATVAASASRIDTILLTPRACGSQRGCGARCTS